MPLRSIQKTFNPVLIILLGPASTHAVDAQTPYGTTPSYA